MQSAGWCEFRYLCAQAKTALLSSAWTPLARKAFASRPDWRARGHRRASPNYNRCTWKRVRQTSLYRTRFVLYKLSTIYSLCNITWQKKYSIRKQNAIKNIYKRLHLTSSRASSFDLVIFSSRQEEGRREPECFTSRWEHCTSSGPSALPLPDGSAGLSGLSHWLSLV